MPSAQDRAARDLTRLAVDDTIRHDSVSLGYFETLLSRSATSTSSEMGEEELRRARISPGLVRVSVGYTGSAEQRWRQLTNALQTVRAT